MSRLDDDRPGDSACGGELVDGLLVVSHLEERRRRQVVIEHVCRWRLLSRAIASASGRAQLTPCRSLARPTAVMSVSW